MEKKEAYKNILPHFQVPGQAYFVTWSLKHAIPRRALKHYSLKISQLHSQIHMLQLKSMLCGNGKEKVINTEAHCSGSNQNIRIQKIRELKSEYYSTSEKYKKVYENLLHMNRNLIVDLTKDEHIQTIREALCFWDGKKLTNFAYCIMPNHVHWVFQLYEKDQKGEPVYLSDIMHSIKRFSANKINKTENRQGSLWQKESFDTTIRDERHLFHVIEYTLNNPIKAGMVKDRNEWLGAKDFGRF